MPPELDDTVVVAPRPGESGSTLAATIAALRGSAPRRTRATPVKRPPAPLRIEFPDGTIVAIDTTVIVGRNPSAPRIPEITEPRLVQVLSPRNEVSSNHVEFRPVHSAVELRDLRSTNGTSVFRPGSSRERLGSGATIVLGAGSVIDLGDGVVLRVVAASG